MGTTLANVRDVTLESGERRASVNALAGPAAFHP